MDHEQRRLVRGFGIVAKQIGFGGVFIAGAVVQWLRDGLGVIKSSVANDRPLRVASRKPSWFMSSNSSIVFERPRNW